MQNYKKIQESVKKYYKAGNVVTRKQIIEATKKEYPEVEEGSIIPSDICINSANQSPYSGQYFVFRQRKDLGRGKYEIL